MSRADRQTAHEHVGVLVIGAGPAGLAASHALAEHGVPDVLVIDRERRAGGVPRHCPHTGFGIRDLHRVMSGPRYADEVLGRAVAAGVRVQVETMATSWSGVRELTLTSPAGVRTVSADAVVLATGARERPRSARLVAGDRPEGVFTTGQLQQWTQVQRLPVGRRAVIVGAEHVSYSAAMTLRSAGVAVAGMVTPLPHHQTYAGFAAAVRRGLRVPLWTDTDVAALHGHGRLRAVELRHGPSARSRSVAADTVVFTGDWVPDNELARSIAVRLDPRSHGPVVDELGATSEPGVYAVGNLAHPGETAAIAAARGAAIGTALASRLAAGDDRAGSSVEIVVEAPLLWCSPGRVADARAVRLPGGLILRADRFAGRTAIRVEQGGRLLARHTVPRLVPNRSLHLPSDWWPRVRPSGETVLLRIQS